MRGDRRSRLGAAAVLAALGVLSGLWVSVHLQDLKTPPWADKVAFNFPFSTAIDQTGRAYAADSATSRLVALDRDGSLRWVLEGRKRTQGFYNALSLAVDSRDDLYVTNWVPLPQQDAVAQEIQIQHYNPAGQLVGTPFRWANTTGSPDFPGYFSFSIHSDQLFIVHASASGYDVLSVPVAGGEPTLVRSVRAPGDFVAIASQPDGHLVGAARNGTLWSAAPRRDWALMNIAGVHKPWDLKFDPDGELLVLDLLQGSILKIGPSGQQVLLDSHVTKGTLSDTFSVAPNGTVVVAEKERQRLLISPFPGEVRAFEGAKYTGTSMLSHWFTWISAIVLGVIVLVGLVAGGVLMMRFPIPLAVIQLALLVPVLVVSQLITFEHVHEGLKAHDKAQVDATLRAAAHLAAKAISGSDLMALNAPGDLDSPAYQRLKQTALAIRSRGRETQAFSYIALYRNLEGQAHIVLTGSGVFGVFYPYSNFPTGVTALFTTPGVRVADYSDDYGEYNGGFASILAPDGTTAGVVEVGLYSDLVSDVAGQAISQARGASVVTGSALAILLLVLTLVLVRTSDSLRRISRGLAEGRIVLPPELKTLDAVSPLSRSLSQRQQALVAQAASEAPFVPRELFELLDLVDVTTCQQDVSVAKDLTVLATHFPSASVPDAAIEAFLAHGGVLDLALGGLCRVLFPRNPTQALEAFQLANRRLASSLLQQSTHCGIHHGSVLLGISGEVDRLSVTAYSGAVTWAEILCDLAERYQVAVVTTASTLERAPGVISRRLDHVRFPNSSQSVLVCEPLDAHDPRSTVVLDYLAGYDEAFSSWERGRLADALAGFEVLSTRNPDDAVVRRHAARCRKLLDTGRGATSPDSPWDPAVDVHEL